VEKIIKIIQIITRELMLKEYVILWSCECVFCICVCVYLNFINWSHKDKKLQARYSSVHSAFNWLKVVRWRCHIVLPWAKPWL